MYFTLAVLIIICISVIILKENGPDAILTEILSSIISKVNFLVASRSWMAHVDSD